MRRFCESLSILFIFASSSHAQITYGVKGGIGFANVGGSDAYSNTTFVRGFVGGAYLKISIPHIPSIQPELLYSMKGENGDMNPASLAISYDPGRIVARRFSYLEIPVLIKLTSSMPFLRPDIYFGPDVGILLSASADYDTTGRPISKINITKGMRSLDWGIVLGASVRVFSIRVDGRYTLGLTPLDTGNSLAIHNEVWSLMAEIPLN